jgi:hypothetical protein
MVISLLVLEKTEARIGSVAGSDARGAASGRILPDLEEDGARPAAQLSATRAF